MGDNDKHILYCGDGTLDGAASYLAGLMSRFGVGFEHVRSDEALSPQRAAQKRKLFILSDYPAAMMSPAAQEQVLNRVRDGAGLLMIGGWESFHGESGRWDGSQIAKALPVEIGSEDDRINCDQPALLIKSEDHAILAGLPWNVRPPAIGGFNRVTTKPATATVLMAQPFAAMFEAGHFTFTPGEQWPILVLGTHGVGRTAALMTDLAPHWSGGLLDWGDSERVKAKAEGASAIEVGNFYSQFVANLLAWVGQLPNQSIR